MERHKIYRDMMIFLGTAGILGWVGALVGDQFDQRELGMVASAAVSIFVTRAIIGFLDIQEEERNLMR